MTRKTPNSSPRVFARLLLNEAEREYILQSMGRCYPCGRPLVNKSTNKQRVCCLQCYSQQEDHFSRDHETTVW